jgi:hypothetical protein
MADRLFIDSDDRRKYEEIKKVIDFLSDKDTKDLFIFAMLNGFKNNQRKQLNRREGFVRTEYLHDQDLAIIKSIAINYESFDILTDLDNVFKIAEELAHAGIDLLYLEINSQSLGSYEKRFEHEVISKCVKI